MAKTKISEFSTTANNNSDINSINISEGCAPSGINDAIRELMRQLKEFQTGGAGDSVNSGGDFSVATNKFTVASASGNTSVAGTLGVTGAATLSSTLAVTGTTTLTGALLANGNATLGDASGDTVTIKGTPTLEVNPTLSGGTANGVLYLNGSKVATSGSALTFDGTNLGLGVTPSAWLGSRSKIEFSSAGTTAGFVGCFNGSSANNQMGLGSNCYLNASSSWIYNNSGAAGRYEILNNAHAWHIAASGTAGNAISFTQAMTLDASGNLCIGTTTASTQLTLYKASGSVGLTAQSGTKYGYFANDGTYLFLGSDQGSTGVKFRVAYAAPDNAATIDSSGRFLLNQTSNNGTALMQMISPATTNAILVQIGTNGYNAMSFLNAGGLAAVGNITIDSSSTSYNTSSDYRLKNTIAPMTGALAKVAALKPVTYKWNADGSDGEGFIAHELAEVCPQAVTGAKDAVDAEGNPQYQGIDTSFLVATLTAAIQELKAEFDAYKASHP